jgi:aspartate carbamoyltransferase catalytic subunit
MTGPHVFGQKHLLGMEHLSAEEITTILDLGEHFLEIADRPIKKVPTLRGKTVINLFLEASTRTRCPPTASTSPPRPRRPPRAKPSSTPRPTSTP